MKKTLLLAAILTGFIGVAAPASVAQADVAVSFSFFHDNLAPYGRWVNVGSYGRCWYPVGVPVGWQPYTVGHWGYGDYGWTWASYDPWGDVTYRYGTWTFAPPYGWVWVPGYTWAPAWVTWSYTNDYIGWAPIPPSFSFSVAGYFGSPVIVNRSAYCFVPTRHFASVNVVNVVNVRVPLNQNQVLLQRGHNVTRFPVSNGVVRNSGLELRHVERASANRVQRVSSRDIRTAPARIETARMSGRRVAVAEPASSRSVSSSSSPRSERAPRDDFRERSSKPSQSSTSDKSRKSKSSLSSDADRSVPAPQPRREARRAPEPRSESSHRHEVARPPAPNLKNRPSASSSSRSTKAPKPSKASQPHESRANSASDLPEFRSKPKASSSARAPEEFRSKPKSQARPSSHRPEGERGRG